MQNRKLEQNLKAWSIQTLFSNWRAGGVCSLFPNFLGCLHLIKTQSQNLLVWTIPLQVKSDMTLTELNDKQWQQFYNLTLDNQTELTQWLLGADEKSSVFTSNYDIMLCSDNRGKLLRWLFVIIIEHRVRGKVKFIKFVPEINKYHMMTLKVRKCNLCITSNTRLNLCHPYTNWNEYQILLSCVVVCSMKYYINNVQETDRFVIIVANIWKNCGIYVAITICYKSVPRNKTISLNIFGFKMAIFWNSYKYQWIFMILFVQMFELC